MIRESLRPLRRYLGSFVPALRTTPGPVAPVVAVVPAPVAATALAAAEAAPDFDGAMAQAGGFDAWLERRRGATRQLVEPAVAWLDANPAAYVECRARILADAARLMQHEFSFLGSGPYCAGDGGAAGDYRPIDWGLDPVSGGRFSLTASSRGWNHDAERPPGGDIKYPWELGRLQHLLCLALAWRIEGERCHLDELFDQCEDFAAANPVGQGVNWVCTMDVALRGFSIAQAVALVVADARSDSARLAALYRHLHDTATFIVGHLENHYEVTSNHYLSNIVGLFAIASEFQDLDSGQAWLEFARGSLEEEIDKQINPDGSDYESSVPYHRLVCELFLAAWQTGWQCGVTFSVRFAARLRDMLEFLAAVERPDGRMPLVGDIDDGRVMLALAYYDWDRRDTRGLLLAGRALLGTTAPRAASDVEAAAFEALCWGAPEHLLHAAAPPRPANTEVFADAGLVVSTDPDHGSYLLVSAGVVGTAGFGNHKHNDLLSFEYHDDGRALIVDPGSYRYTGDPAARNLFRSTAGHNTLGIDGVEQNEMNPEWLFRLFEKAAPSLLQVTDAGEQVTVAAAHSGYRRLERGAVVHRRDFAFDRTRTHLRIVDTLTGQGTHTLSWRFHFDPGVRATVVDANTCELRHGDDERVWRLDWTIADADARLTTGWFAPSYGVREPASVLELSLPVELATVFVAAFGVVRA